MKFLKNAQKPKKLKKAGKEITFSSKYEDYDYGGDNENPYIYLASYEESIACQKNKNEIVLKSNKAIVVATYPLNGEFLFEISTKNKNGFTRKAIAKEIGKIYEYIYETEDKSSNEKVVPFDDRGTLMNRNETDGIFGIWGHDLGDLCLGGIYVYMDTDGNYYLTLGIDS